MDVVNTMQKVNDEMYLDVCCYHTQQAIEKLLKCSIELKGVNYEFTHSITKLYSQYVSAGWDEIEILELMAGPSLIGKPVVDTRSLLSQQLSSLTQLRGYTMNC